MKKLIVIPILLLAILSVTARDISDYDYVVTKNATYFCSQITFGLVKVKCMLDNGKVITLKPDEVFAYKKDGKIFERMVVYIGNQPTSKLAFMQLIAMKDGLKLYRYSEPDESYHGSSSSDYYVFKNKTYMLQICRQNCRQVFSYFGLKVA